VYQDDNNNNAAKTAAAAAGGAPEDVNSYGAFTRCASRKSLASNAAMIQWLEAQERTQQRLEVRTGCVLCCNALLFSTLHQGRLWPLNPGSSFPAVTSAVLISLASLLLSVSFEFRSALSPNPIGGNGGTYSA